MIDAELLKIMCCPETHQPLVVANSEQVTSLNSRILNKSLANRAGQPVTESLDGGLVREDGRFLYPIRKNIPIMLVDEAIPLV